jgi:hypothetical protein
LAANRRTAHPQDPVTLHLLPQIRANVLNSGLAGAFQIVKVQRPTASWYHFPLQKCLSNPIQL